MCFMTNAWTTKSWSFQCYDQNESLRNQLYEQTLDKQILNCVTKTWPECQRIQSVRDRIRETQSGGHGNWLNLTLWSAYLSTVPPWGHPSSETVTHEARRCVRKNRPSCNGVRAMKNYETKFWNWHLRQGRPSLGWFHFKARGHYETKFWNWHLRQGRPSLRWIQFQNSGQLWNQVLNLASKTKKVKSQMGPFQNQGKLWNQVLKLASRTRKAKSQMDPFQNLGNYESKFWHGHRRQGRPSPR